MKAGLSELGEAGAWPLACACWVCVCDLLAMGI